MVTQYTITRDGIHVDTTSNPEHWFPFTRGYTMAEGIHHHGYTVTEATPLSVMVERERERIARMDAILPLD